MTTDWLVTTDPGEIALLKKVRAMPPQAQEALTQLAQAAVDREPAHVVRQAALDFMRAKGLSAVVAVQEADRFMRSVVIHNQPGPTQGKE